jgi:signal transduction histidine kinase/Tfp pilus assembly protein PilF
MKKLFLIVFSLAWLSGSTQHRDLDSLNRVLSSTPDDQKIEVYQEIIIRLWLNHPDSAMEYARKSVTLSHTLDDTRTKAIAYRMLGAVHYYKGNYDSTIKYSYIAYEFSKTIRDSTLMCNVMNNIGLAFYNMGSYTEALEYLLRTMKLRTKIGQEYGQSQTLNNIGLVYTELKDYEKAREYFLMAKDISLTRKDDNQLLYSLNNLAFTYLEEKDFRTAENLFAEALKIAGTIDNTNWHAVSYSGMAQAQLQQNKTVEAKGLFRKSLALRKKISDRSGIAEVYSFLGGIFTKQGLRDSARFYLHHSRRLAVTIRDRDQMIFTFDKLKELYTVEGRFDSALFYQSKFIAIRDSVYNENLARNIKSIQFEIEREESQSKLAAKDNEIRKITVQTYGLIGLIILSLIFSVFLYRSYKDHRRLTEDLVKTNVEITRQKEEIHVQRDKLALSHDELEAAKEVITQKNIELSKLNWQLQNTVDKRTQELDQANQELKVVNLELENFIYRSSHDIRGPLVRLLGICHVALLDIKEERAKEYFGMLFEAAQQLNEIFDRLKLVSNINETTIKPVHINFNDLLNQVLERLKNMEGYSDVEIQRENAANDWYSDSFLLELILFNMIENSIRFQKKSTSEAKFVKIKTARNGSYVKLVVIDNGVGIREPVSDNLYQMFSKAARDNRNIGLGLYIVKQCLNKLNGSINLVQNDDGYTEFEVLHPILN